MENKGLTDETAWGLTWGHMRRQIRSWLAGLISDPNINRPFNTKQLNTLIHPVIQSESEDIEKAASKITTTIKIVIGWMLVMSKNTVVGSEIAWEVNLARDENSSVCNCSKSCPSAVPTNPHKFAFIRPRNYSSTNMAADIVFCV